MKINQTQKILDPRFDNPMPSPINPIECACGCGHLFQPQRKDQVYLNKQHADFAYNHGKRKERIKTTLEQEKILRKNDSILERYFKKSKRKKVICFYDILLADGFRFEFFIGQTVTDDILYHFTYNYCYETTSTKPVQVKIYKR
ncbi:MAG: hypothetical protein EP305_04305 [Bacteroidetes bacterium]|nr:MAG: hypothetical protein EP305_04305 [Bacteroidota bacterium]